MSQSDAKLILKNGFQNIQSKNGGLTISDIESEVINQACRYIIKNYSNQLESVHDINKIGNVLHKNMKFNPIADMFINTAIELFPNDYGKEEINAAKIGIIQNISWAGMWDHLRNYFQKKHGESIDDVIPEPSIFYSQNHRRIEFGQVINEVQVERNVNIGFLENKSEVIVSIEPTLSAKKGYLVSKESNKIIYDGADPDYKFTIILDMFEEVEEFILELPKRSLKLHYT